MISPMLADPATEDRLIPLCYATDYAAEQQLDGQRLLIQVHDGTLHTVSRSGLHLPVHPRIPAAFSSFVDSGAEWVFDGEYLKDCYYVFDLVLAGTETGPTTPFRERRLVLEELWDR